VLAIVIVLFSNCVVHAGVVISGISAASKSFSIIGHKFNVNLHRGHPFMTSTRRGYGSGSGGRMWTGGGGSSPYGRPHRKLKLESTDVILSSSHAKKLASVPEFRLWTDKSGNFAAI